MFADYLLSYLSKHVSHVNTITIQYWI